MDRRANVFFVGFSLFFAMVSVPLHAGTPGLPFTEDFADTALMDLAQTNANWSTAEQAAYLAWHRQRLAGFPDGNSPGLAVSAEIESTHSVTFGDVDGNGFLDLVTGNNNVTNKLYLNNGSSFDPSINIGSETDSTHALFLEM